MKKYDYREQRATLDLQNRANAEIRRTAYMVRAAETRGLFVPDLTKKLMEVICDDRMVDAILDDGLTTPETKK